MSLLTAILEPRVPIADVTVLNPDTPKESSIEKGAVLDVRVRAADGRQFNVEMQAAPHPGLRQRFLYYWARLYTSQLGRGDPYIELAPTTSIFIFDFKELETPSYHSELRLLEVREHTELSDDLAIHFLELPKLPKGPPSPSDPAVLKWSKFFVASNEELEQLAMTDPNLQEAKDALEQLSSDPHAQELARERELAIWNYKRGLKLEREAGREEGRREGERRVLLRQLGARFGSVAKATRERIDSATSDELERYTERLLTAKTLEEVFD